MKAKQSGHGAKTECSPMNRLTLLYNQGPPSFQSISGKIEGLAEGVNETHNL